MCIVFFYATIMNESLYESYADRLPLKDMNICRFCVRKKRKMQNISSASMGGNYIADLFKQVTRLQFDTSSDYPDLICSDCEKTLQATAKSVEAFLEADAFWRMYFYRKLKEENIGKQEVDFKFEESNYPEHTSGGESDYEIVASPAPPSPSEVVVQYVVVEEDDFKIEMLEDMSDVPDIKTDKEPDEFKTYSCETCGKVARTEAMLEKHIEKNHPSAESFMCDNCGEICTTKSELKQHINLYHKQYVCIVCSEEFPSR